MKKFISLVLALTLALSLVAVAGISVSAETFDKTLITFDNAAERTVVTHTNDFKHYIVEKEGFGTGKSVTINMPNTKGNSLQIRLTPGWKAYKPTAIKFLIMNTESMGAVTLKVGFGSTADASSSYTQGLTVIVAEKDVATWVEVSLDGLDISGFNYMSVGKPNVNANIYIDDITLVCPTAELANGAYDWNTMIDWEDGVSAAVASAKPVTITSSTEFSSNTISASAKSLTAKTSGWNDQRESNYITINLDADKMASADDLRIHAKAEKDNVDIFGVVIEGETYWRTNVLTKTWQPLYVLEEVFTAQSDNSTTKLMYPSDIAKITAIKLSFTQNSKDDYGTTIYADDIEYAQFKTDSSSTVTEPTITMDKGAAMRIDSKTDGIRFSATVEKDVLDAYTAAGATVTEVGMLVAKSGITENDMVVTNAKESPVANAQIDSNVIAAKYGDVTMKTNESANAYEIVGSLVEIKTANATQQYVARAYITFTVGKDTKTVYSGISESRSIKDVATAVKADTAYYDSLCANHKATVDKWL